MLAVAKAVDQHRDAILAQWLKFLKDGNTLRTGRIREAELVTQATNVFNLLQEALKSGDPSGDAFAHLTSSLADISRSRAVQGFTRTDTALFVFSLRSRFSRR